MYKKTTSEDCVRALGLEGMVSAWNFVFRLDVLGLRTFHETNITPRPHTVKSHIIFNLLRPPTFQGVRFN